MISPTDLLHPSPAPHFETFQVLDQKHLESLCVRRNSQYIFDSTRTLLNLKLNVFVVTLKVSTPVTSHGDSAGVECWASILILRHSARVQYTYFVSVMLCVVSTVCMLFCVYCSTTASGYKPICSEQQQKQQQQLVRQSCQIYAPTALWPQRNSVVLISVGGWVDPRATERGHKD
jgi:hypothetical protein